MLRGLLLLASMLGLLTAGALTLVETRETGQDLRALLPLGSVEALNSELDRGIDDFDAATRNADRLLRISSLRRIEDLCRKILAQRPANSETWALLADIELKKGGSIEQALKFYELSHLTGRLEWPAIRRRTIFAVPVWAELGDTGRSIAEGDIRKLLAGAAKHRAIAFLAELEKASPHSPGAAAVRQSVASVAPDWLKEFDWQVRK